MAQGSVKRGMEGTVSSTIQSDLIGDIDGSNAVFTSPGSFVPSNVRIYVNGMLQKIINDYQLSNSNTITFTFSPNVGDSLTIVY